MGKILITGCSASNNCGWDEPTGKVWWHPLSIEHGGAHTITNLAVDGNTNHDIMVDTIEHLITNTTDLAIIQWTGFLRQTFYLTKSVSAKERIYFSVMPKRPIELSRAQLKNSKHEASLIHWQENFVNVRRMYNTNYTYFIATANYLLNNNIPFIFLNVIVGGVHFEDLLTPDWTKTSTLYKNEVLLWPVCGKYEAEKAHHELHTKIIELKRISEANWVHFSKAFWFKNCPDTADDGRHPGIESAKIMRNDIIATSRALGYNIL